jgi:hypothetical protein
VSERRFRITVKDWRGHLELSGETDDVGRLLKFARSLWKRGDIVVAIESLPESSTLTDVEADRLLAAIRTAPPIPSKPTRGKT